MCGPVAAGIAIGAAVGATTSAITGGDPLMGAILGGATGGFNPGAVGVFSATRMQGMAAAAQGLVAVSLPGVAMAAGVGLAGGYLMNAMTPQQQDYNQDFTGMPYTPQPYNTQHMTVTGSGGRQAAAVLASEIKQAKSLRKRQAEVADYGLGMDMAGTGLQIA